MSARIRRIVSYVRSRIEWSRLPEGLKRVVVAHEAGHALAAWHLEAVDGIEEVSVLSDGIYRGFTKLVERRGPYRASEVVQLMIMGMAGMAGERLLVGIISEGGQDDTLHVIAYWLAIKHGMPLAAAFVIAATVTADLYGDDERRRAGAEAAFGPMLEALHLAALVLLQPRLAGLQKLAAELYRKRRLRHRDLERLLGPRTYVTTDELFASAAAPP